MLDTLHGFGTAGNHEDNSDKSYDNSCDSKNESLFEFYDQIGVSIFIGAMKAIVFDEFCLSNK